MPFRGRSILPDIPRFGPRRVYRSASIVITGIEALGPEKEVQMEALILIGRILFSLIFIGAGIGHLADAEGSSGYAESRDAPSSGIVIRLSGVLIAAGGLGVMLGVWMDLAALGLAVYCLLTALLVHHFWTDEGSDLQREMAMFMKNVSMAGAGLMIFALSAGGAAMGWQLGSPLFSL